MQGSRLRAKGEKIVFDTEDGQKEYLIKPLRNEQLLEIQELWDSKKQTDANIKFVMYSLNRDPKIEAGTEPYFTEEEIKQMETPFLIEIMKTASKVNGIDKMVEFADKKKQELISQSESKPNTFMEQVSKLPPAKKLS